MSGLRTLIQSCDKCELCKNMSVSPVAIEYFGKEPTDVLIIVGSTVKEQNDLMQEVISGPNREIIKNIFTKLNLSFATTFLVKCITNKPINSKRNVVLCEWIKKEIDVVRPKYIIGMGDVKYADINFDLITKSPHLELGNKESTVMFSKKIERLLND